LSQPGMNVQPEPAIRRPFSKRYASGANGTSTVTKLPARSPVG